MKHELLIHCFGQWWKHDVEEENFILMPGLIKVNVPLPVLSNSKIVYDKTTKKLLQNKSNTFPDQIEMEVWMLGPLPTLNIKRRAFERQRKSYVRMKKEKETFNNIIDKKL